MAWARKKLRRTKLGTLAGFALLAATALATSAAAQDQEKPTELAPAELVRLAVANEVAAHRHPHGLHMFRSRKHTPRGSQTHLYVETTQAIAAMLVAVNGKPLNPQQQQAETDHLTGLIDNPDHLRKKQAREKEDEDRTMRIVNALPDAFLYQYAGSEKSAGGEGAAADPLARLTFKPNPAYSPPSRVEQVLAGMQGYLLIDTKVRRIARIDGTLFREVTFAWGILGHLDAGGHFLVRQADLGLGDGAWGITEISLNVTGKLLLFKSLNLISDEVLSGFRIVPQNLTFAQGVEMLKTEQEKLAHDMQPDQPPPDQPSQEQKTPQ